MLSVRWSRQSNAFEDLPPESPGTRGLQNDMLCHLLSLGHPFMPGASAPLRLKMRGCQVQGGGLATRLYCDRSLDLLQADIRLAGSLAAHCCASSSGQAALQEH